MNKKMEKIGANEAVVMPPPLGIELENKYAIMGAEIIKKINNRRGSIRFHYFAMFALPSDNKYSVEDEHKRGARGIKIYPKSKDDNYYMSIIEEADNFGLPIVFHTSVDKTEYHPYRIGEMAAKSGVGKIVLAHSGKMRLSETINDLLKIPNVFFDTSALTLYQKTVLLDMTKGKRVIFGSDSPYSDPAIEVMLLEKALEQAGIFDDSVREDIFYCTAKKILGEY